MTAVVSLLLAAAPGFTSEPKAPPSPLSDGAVTQVGPIREVPDSSGTGTASIFVGNYGESIELHPDWTAEATMTGMIETVYFHRKSQDLLGLHPIRPRASDYRADNFAPMMLMELVVIPKNAPRGFTSLKAILQAKAVELAQTRAEYEMTEVSNNRTWPLGTVHVQSKRPYKLWQIYSESPKEFYILTLGGPLKEGDYGLSRDLILNYNSADALLRDSLSAHLLAVHKQTLGEYLFRPLPSHSSELLGYLKLISANTRYWIVLGASTICLLLAAMWPGKSPWARRANSTGRSLIAFSAVSGFVAFMVVYVPARFYGVVWRHSMAPEIISLFLLPWIGWSAAKNRGSVRSKSVLFWCASLATLLAAFSFMANEIDTAGSAASLAFSNVSLFLFLGLVFGVVFALAIGPLPDDVERP